MTIRHATILAAFFAGAASAAAIEERDMTAGAVMPATWTYSVDGGKTFTPEPPKITGMHAPNPARRDAARAQFTVADPAAVGLLKIATRNSNGAFALTDANSVDRYNVGSSPTLLETKIVLNGKPTTLGLQENTLYRYLAVPPGELKKGPNTLELAGNFWHKNYSAGAVACHLQLEVISTNQAALDRLPVLGFVGEDYFGIACRAVIDSKFSVSVTPLEPGGPPATHAFGPARQLKAKVPLPRGTKKFTYTVTVTAGGASATYGPYPARAFRPGVGFRFIAAGGTATYRQHYDGVRGFLKAAAARDPDLVLHTGNYQNCPAWDFMWTEEFLRESQPTFASIPLFATANITEMMSPGSFAQTFYFPPDDADWANWTAVVGNVRFVAVEAFGQAHDKTGAGVTWLEGVLKNAKEDYVLVFNAHVTGTSPTSFDEWYRDGVKHTAARIDPLLIKYNVTATIGNIHRCYQRVDPPAGAGVPTILTGKAGGLGWPLRTREVPYSKALSGADHYLLFEVKPTGLDMQAIDLSGKVLDSCTFKPRK